jgi:hypothetical protein
LVKTPVEASAVDQFTKAEVPPVAPRLVASEEPIAPTREDLALQEGKGDARLIVSMPQELHRNLKIRCAERGITIRAYMLSLLEADGIR